MIEEEEEEEEELDEEETERNGSLEEDQPTEGEDMHLFVQRLLQMTRRFHDERDLVARSTSDSKRLQGAGGSFKERPDLLRKPSFGSFPHSEDDSSALLLQPDSDPQSDDAQPGPWRQQGSPSFSTAPGLDASQPPSAAGPRVSSSSRTTPALGAPPETLRGGGGDGCSRAAGPRLNRPFLAAVASYCLRLLQQVERQQALRHQQIVHRTGAVAAAGAARGCGSGTSSWALMGAAGGFSAAKGCLRGGGGGEALGGAWPGGGPALYGATLFNSGPVLVLGKRAAVSQAVWDMQMCDAVAVEAMRIIDLICRADAELVATVFPTIKRVTQTPDRTKKDRCSARGAAFPERRKGGRGERISSSFPRFGSPLRAYLQSSHDGPYHVYASSAVESLLCSTRGGATTRLKRPPGISCQLLVPAV